MIRFSQMDLLFWSGLNVQIQNLWFRSDPEVQTGSFDVSVRFLGFVFYFLDLFFFWSNESGLDWVEPLDQLQIILGPARFCSTSFQNRIRSKSLSGFEQTLQFRVRNKDQYMINQFGFRCESEPWTDVDIWMDHRFWSGTFQGIIWWISAADLDPE